jgi:hypothetical protein
MSADMTTRRRNNLPLDSVAQSIQFGNNKMENQRLMDQIDKDTKLELLRKNNKNGSTA